MISPPSQGWATVTVGEYQLDVSYILPVPEMLLTAFIRALSVNSVADVTFDAEGFTWRMEVGAETHLTILDSCPKSVVVPVSLQDMARMALTDIRRNMDAWCRWNRSESEDTQRSTLMRLCDRLDELLA